MNILTEAKVASILRDAERCLRSDDPQVFYDLADLCHTVQEARAVATARLDGQLIQSTAEYVARLRADAELITVCDPTTLLDPEAAEALHRIVQAAEGKLVDARFTTGEHAAVSDPTPEDRQNHVTLQNKGTAQ